MAVNNNIHYKKRELLIILEGLVRRIFMGMGVGDYYYY